MKPKEITVQDLLNFLNYCDPDAPIALHFDQAPEWKAEVHEMWKEGGLPQLSLRLRELAESRD